MLQGVLLAAVYMCMLAKELPAEKSSGVLDKQVTAGDGRTARNSFGMLAKAQITRDGEAVDAGEAC